MVIDQVPRLTAHSILYHEKLRPLYILFRSNTDTGCTYIIMTVAYCDMLPKSAFLLRKLKINLLRIIVILIFLTFSLFSILFVERDYKRL